MHLCLLVCVFVCVCTHHAMPPFLTLRSTVKVKKCSAAGPLQVAGLATLSWLLLFGVSQLAAVSSLKAK